MTKTLTIEDYLSQIYAADVKGNGDKTTEINALKTAMGGDTDLLASARARFTALTALIAARGTGACAYSTKYQEYLTEALS